MIYHEQITPDQPDCEKMTGQTVSWRAVRVKVCEAVRTENWLDNQTQKRCQ